MTANVRTGCCFLTEHVESAPLPEATSAKALTNFYLPFPVGVFLGDVADERIAAALRTWVLMAHRVTFLRCFGRGDCIA
jgi:hypothetical protein